MGAADLPSLLSPPIVRAAARRECFDSSLRGGVMDGVMRPARSPVQALVVAFDGGGYRSMPSGWTLALEELARGRWRGLRLRGMRSARRDRHPAWSWALGVGSAWAHVDDAEPHWSICVCPRVPVQVVAARAVGECCTPADVAGGPCGWCAVRADLGMVACARVALECGGGALGERGFAWGDGIRGLYCDLSALGMRESVVSVVGVPGFGPRVTGLRAADVGGAGSIRCAMCAGLIDRAVVESWAGAGAAPWLFPSRVL